MSATQKCCGTASQSNIMQLSLARRAGGNSVNLVRDNVSMTPSRTFAELASRGSSQLWYVMCDFTCCGSGEERTPTHYGCLRIPSNHDKQKFMKEGAWQRDASLKESCVRHAVITIHHDCQLRDVIWKTEDVRQARRAFSNGGLRANSVTPAHLRLGRSHLLQHSWGLFGPGCELPWCPHELTDEDA